MITKIRGVIQREKQKNPKGLALVLLINRLIKVTGRNVRHFLTRDSTFTSKDTMPMCSLFPKRALDIVILNIRPQSILDIGCGTGVSLSYFIDNGIDAWGIENSALAASNSKNPERILKYNLNKSVDLQKKFDLVWCFEVIEHIHPMFESSILKTLTSHGPLVILSAAKPGQGGHGHFNEQNEEYWIKKFSDLGYVFDEKLSLNLRETKEEHAENLMVFNAQI